MKTARSRLAGMSMVEIIVSAAIIAVAVTGIAGAWQLYLKVAGQTTQYAQAALMIEEGEEAVTVMRDFGWIKYIDPLAPDTPYYLSWDGATYSATQAEQTSANGYQRTLVFRPVSRDPSSKNIVTSGGTGDPNNDPNTKNVLISVFLAGNQSKVLGQSDMLIHNVYNN